MSGTALGEACVDDVGVKRAADNSLLQARWCEVPVSEESALAQEAAPGESAFEV